MIEQSLEATVELNAQTILPTSGDALAEPSAELAPEKLTLLERFAKTSTAANLTGSFNEAAGAIKRKLGQLTDDAELGAEGRDQQLRGKVYHLVGDVREIRELAARKLLEARVEITKMVREHGGNYLDATSKLLADVKSKLS